MKIKSRVKLNLDKYPHLKDDDNKLFATIWLEELSDIGFNAKERTAFELLKEIAQNKLTPAPSIKRARAKLQEEEPKYRGEKYHQRQSVLQEKWRNDLGYRTK